VINSYNKTGLYVWKDKSLCVEEITQWKYRMTNETACEETYAACGTNLYCVENITGELKCPIDGIILYETNNASTYNPGLATDRWNVTNFKDNLQLYYHFANNESNVLAFLDISTNGASCLNKEKLRQKPSSNMYLLLSYHSEKGCGTYGEDKLGTILDKQMEIETYEENIPMILTELPMYNETL
jgi:hypothetical protein